MTPMVYIKRTFHPVGQGAFFTEQFYDNDKESLLYNVVYDCGSLSGGIKTQMERTVRNCLHDKKEIDVLFLSHFDDDHVNYVNYLNANGYLNGTRIFIPMLAAEEWLGIDPYAKNYNNILSLNNPALGGTKVIRVNFDNEEQEAGGQNDPITIENVEEDVIPSGTVLTPSIRTSGIIWCYTPFNVQFKALIAEFQRKLRAEGLSYNQLTNKNYVVKNKKELEEVYKHLGKKPSGGSAINLNSLLVMSYPKDSSSCFIISNRGGAGWYSDDWWWYHGDGFPGSCLYTGDTSANEDFVWNRMLTIVDQCLGKGNRLAIMQVPHHGSRNSYDDKLVSSKKFITGFTNYAPDYRQHIFDENLPLKFALARKPLLLVTKDYASKYEEYFGVK